MEVYCAIPLSVLTIVATIANLSMVIHSLKSNSSSFMVSLVFKLIGMSNVACSVCFFILWIAYLLNSKLHVLWVISVALTISMLLQLGFNLSLAFLRYQVVINPLDYFTSESKLLLEKKLCIAVFAGTLLLCFVCTMVRFLFSNVRFFTILIAISRIIGFILLCIFYVKLYFAMRSQNQAIAANIAEQGQSTTSNKELITRRKKQLRHTKRFFIGIITSFFVLNLPSMVMFFIVNRSPKCKTLQGWFTIISTGLSCVNMVFDAIWYFYMERRSRRM